jgi:hypothetical protein
MLLREKLVQAEIAAARAGIREVGANNHGPWVKRFLAEVGLPEGYAWCDAFQSYEEHAVAGARLPIESASVAQTYELAKARGWLAAIPARGDLGCINWTAAGPPFGDHIALVISARSLPGYWKLQTVEGNTSSGVAGSQGDGDGVFLRTRVIAKRQIAFVRIPGAAAVAAPNVDGRRRVAAALAEASPPLLKRGATGSAVRILQRRLHAHGAKVAIDGVFGPRTAASLRAFQKRNGLPVTATTNARTWRALNKGGVK